MTVGVPGRGVFARVVHRLFEFDSAANDHRLPSAVPQHEGPLTDLAMPHRVDGNGGTCAAYPPESVPCRAEAGRGCPPKGCRMSDFGSLQWRGGGISTSPAWVGAAGRP